MTDDQFPAPGSDPNADTGQLPAAPPPDGAAPPPPADLGPPPAPNYPPTTQPQPVIPTAPPYPPQASPPYPSQPYPSQPAYGVMAPSGVQAPLAHYPGPAVKKVGFEFGKRLVGLVVALAAVFGIWGLLTLGGDDSIVDTESTFPTIGAVGESLGDLISNDDLRGASFWSNLVDTLARFLAIVVLGATVGTIVGGAMGWTSWLRFILDPIASFFRMVPIPLFLPLVFLWRGLGNDAIILSGTLVVAWVVAGGIQEAMAAKRRGTSLSVAADVLGVLRWAVFVGWWATISSEVLGGAPDGLGTMAFAARNFFRIDVMVALLIIIGLIGLLAESSVRVVQYLVRSSAANRNAVQF